MHVCAYMLLHTQAHTLSLLHPAADTVLQHHTNNGPICHSKREHSFAYKNLPLWLYSLFLCRVRTEKKISRKRRGRRPKKKGAAATAAAAESIIWCRVLSPAAPLAHCAARPCRKSMACNAWVSNTAVTVFLPDTQEHRCSAHTRARICLGQSYRTDAHTPTCWSTQTATLCISQKLET